MKKCHTSSFYCGLLLFLLGLVLTIPIGLSLLLNESTFIFKRYIESEFIILGSGSFFIFWGRNHKNDLDISSSMLLCAFSWVVLSFFGAIPFMLVLKKSIVDGFFESVSGFTTTGITVFSGLDLMPHSILLWRSLIQWMGGLGILTFFLFVTFRSEGGVWHLFTAESHKINASRPVPNIFKTVKILWLIYSILTLLETLILMALGLCFFDAINHSLTTLSTGGFSNYDQSVGYFSNHGFVYAKGIEYTITFFMFLGGMNFLMHFHVLKRQFKDVISDTETQRYVSIIFISTLLIVISIFTDSTKTFIPIETTFRKTLFQVVSVITTTGFGTEDIGSSFFTSLAKQLFLVLMLIGGCIGSTSGGIKVLRITVLNRLFRREIKKIQYPRNAVIPVTINKQVINDEEVSKVAAIAFVWILVVIIGAMITALFSHLGPLEAGSGMLSAVSNIGPFYFSVQEMIEMPSVVKLTYCLGMLAGRLEMLPIFLLFSPRAWRS